MALRSISPAMPCSPCATTAGTLLWGAGGILLTATADLVAAPKIAALGNRLALVEAEA